MYGEEFKATIKEVPGGLLAYVSRNDDLAKEGYSDDEVPISGEVIGTDLDDLTKNVQRFLASKSCTVKVTGLILAWS